MDDDYVAQILAKEAKESSIKYASQGMSAFMPLRPTSNAPKPNTRFLRNLIKTVLPNDLIIGVKYEDQEIIGGESGKIVFVPIAKELEVAPLQRNKTGRGGVDKETKITAGLEREAKIAMNIGANKGTTSHLGGIDGIQIRNTPGGGVSDHTRGLQAVLPTKTEVPTAITIEDKNINLGLILAPSPVPAHQIRTNLGGQSGKMCRHMSPAVLALKPHDINEEDLVGPLPPRQNEAPIRSRGRGAYKHNVSNIDAHFAPGYDPATDVHLDEDKLHSVGQESSRRPVAGLMTKEDDWDMAMEALRDRERWRNKGEERLRTAGIDEATIDKWKKNTAFAGVDGKGKPEDVQWSKKGEGREWDRGKFVDDDGHIDVRAAW
ncbi:hypothetical protein PDIG_04800 [Penicillium digitatum PHI26]|uniref:Uncharacterized protein n=2 Tax=Penicillium digitatum TaxID=36651 RepID=K9GWK8_PEND2|nr:hypothetical protein PDIP_09470 [Penicillium digitatum Pd1]EKV18983.1 hypothetical protein PDIG_04800 [Penicillium digitatum PHI26]EKV21121.1 hypothetical protein PDIP_09470 [Penicillium digitatum Pd1]